MDDDLNLTRFYGNWEYALDCIEDKRLTLIRPDKFNDPMDYRLHPFYQPIF